MKVDLLKTTSGHYSGNAYLLRGEWNRLDDVNTLIDCSSDGQIIAAVEALATGLGKVPVEAVILTHSHFDHSGGLEQVRERYRPAVYARDTAIQGCSDLVDGQILRAGDGWLEVICVNEHSSDSVCLYAAHEKIIFTGDTPVRVLGAGTYQQEFIDFLERLAGLKIEAVYPGHGRPLQGDIHAMLRRSIETIRGKVN